MKRLFILAILAFVPAISLAQVNCTPIVGIDTAFTTPAVDDRTVGGSPTTLLVAFTAAYTGYAMVTEAAGPANTWRIAGIYGNVSTNITISFALNPNTSATHKWKHTGGSSISLSGSVIYACSGNSPYDVIEAITPALTDHGGGVGVFTCQAPSALSPLAAGDTEFTATFRTGSGGVPHVGWTATNDGPGFSTPYLDTPAHTGGNGLNSAGVAVSWKAATDTSSFRPTWTMTSSNGVDDWYCVNVVIRATATLATGGGSPFVKVIAGNGYQSPGTVGPPSCNNCNPLTSDMNWPSEMVWWATAGIPSGKILIEVDNQNNIVRAINFDSSSHSVFGQTIGAGNIATIVGTGVQTCTGNGGAAIGATLSHPVGLAQDSVGNIYIADQQCATIDKVSLSGTFTYVAGGGPGGVPNVSCGGSTHPYHGNVQNVLATSALISCPQGVAIDSHDNIIVSDGGNNKIEVVNVHGTTQTLYGISVPAGFIEVIAGTGTRACTLFSGTPVTAATSLLIEPLGLDVDSSDNIISGGLCSQVYKIRTDGKIVGLAGTGVLGWSASGTPGLSAQIAYPFHTGPCTVNSFYTVCWVDTYNNEFRYLDSSGNVQTLMGNYQKWGGRSAASGYIGGGAYGDNWSAKNAEPDYPIGYAQNPADGSFAISSLMSNVIFQTYTPTNTNLTVGVTGSGAGTVTSADGFINCGVFCSHAYVPGTLVTLTANIGTHSAFSGFAVTGWGACPINPCQVTMPVDSTVTATFSLTSLGNNAGGTAQAGGKSIFH